MQIEEVANRLRERKSADQLKRAQIKGIPRQAVLKPSHAVYRLLGQKFALGDRVVMVQDAAAGGVPLGMKGVVVGLGVRDIDVVWDVPFMGGETLGGRCSNYRGSVVPFSSCLNLTDPQFAVGEKSQPAVAGSAAPFKPQIGPRPVVAPNNYQPSRPGRNPVIMQNPGRHAPPANGNLHFGNAAKGMQAPAAPQQFSHRDRLASTLTGGGPRQYIAKGPQIKPVSPTAAHRQLPTGKPVSPMALQHTLPPIPAPAAQGHHGHGQGHGHRGRGRGRGAAPNVDGSHAAPQDNALHASGGGRGGGRGGSRGRGGRGRGRGHGQGGEGRAAGAPPTPAAAAAPSA